MVAVDKLNDQPSNPQHNNQTPPTNKPESDHKPEIDNKPDEPAPPKPVISGVTISLGSTSGYTEGDTITATANVTPNNLTDKVTYEWSISGSSTTINNNKTESINFVANKEDNNRKLKVVATCNGKHVENKVTLTIKSTTPSPQPAPSPAPSTGSITSVSLETDYTEYYEGDEIRILAVSAKNGDIDSNAITYEWHKILNGRDEILTDQTTYEFNSVAAVADNGMQIYVNVSYKGNVTKSNTLDITVLEDDVEEPGPSVPIVPPTSQPEVPSPEENFDAVDKAPAPDLVVPAGYKDWKGKLPKVDRSPIGSNAMQDKEKVLTWDKIEMEMVYQARFILFQSFENNFSQITYYSRAIGNNQWEAIAEGILANNVTNGEAPIQCVGTNTRNPYTANSGDRVKVSIIASKGSWKASYTNGSWSFAHITSQIDAQAKSEFLFQLPTMDINVLVNGRNLVNKNLPVPRAYSFVIGRTKAS